MVSHEDRIREKKLEDTVKERLIDIDTEGFVRFRFRKRKHYDTLLDYSITSIKRESDADNHAHFRRSMLSAKVFINDDSILKDTSRQLLSELRDEDTNDIEIFHNTMMQYQEFIAEQVSGEIDPNGRKSDTKPDRSTQLYFMGKEKYVRFHKKFEAFLAYKSQYTSQNKLQNESQTFLLEELLHPQSIKNHLNAILTKQQFKELFVDTVQYKFDSLWGVYKNKTPQRHRDSFSRITFPELRILIDYQNSKMERFYATIL